MSIGTEREHHRVETRRKYKQFLEELRRRSIAVFLVFKVATVSSEREPEVLHVTLPGPAAKHMSKLDWQIVHAAARAAGAVVECCACDV